VDDDDSDVDNEAEGSRDTTFIMRRVKVKVKQSLERDHWGDPDVDGRILLR
jgi:L-arabinose isomerase